MCRFSEFGIQKNNKNYVSIEELMVQLDREIERQNRLKYSSQKSQSNLQIINNNITRLEIKKNDINKIQSV